MEVKPIGFIKTPFKEKFGTPRQGSLVPSAHAEIILNKSIPEGSLEGLKDFSHIWILFHFHQNTNTKIKGKVFPPRLQGKSMGWAATRTPHRPNDIGMTLAKIEAVDNNSIFISGIDIVDGTPILDIKPYVSGYDRPKEFHEGWTSDVNKKFLKIEWSTLAKEKIQEFSIEKKTLNFIEESLSLDPRPMACVSKTYSSSIEKWDFHFNVTEGLLIINDISLC